MDRAALIYEQERVDRYAIVLRYEDGTEERLPAHTPAEDLIAVTEVDYSSYRRAVKRLWEEHPLFEERPVVRVKEPCSTEGISEADYEDFMEQALALPDMLREIDPVTCFCMHEILRREFRFEDDGSAEFLLEAGTRTLRFLWDPILVQIYFRNIFEMTFDGMERATQAERYNKLCAVYPEVGQHCDPHEIPPAEDGRWILTSHHLFQLRLLELALYFKQGAQRIARCEYCWRYYIPKTKKATRYCDRVTDGFPCKKRGARFKRNLKKEQDPALLICDQLRGRMYSRFQRYQDTAPKERDRLFPMTYERYDAWSENARLARIEYMDKKIRSEEFLRRIDITHELTSYEAEKAALIEQSAWQRRVAGDLGFDPEEFYPSKVWSGELNEDGSIEWEVITGDEMRRWEQRSHQSLREKYGKGPPLA